MAGGELNSHFLCCLRSESEMSMQNCSLVLLRGQKWTELSPVLDATRQSREASERSAFTDYSRAKDGRPTGAPAAESCGRARGGGRQHERCWRDRSKIFQVSRKKEAKTAGVAIAGLRPLLGRAANRGARKLKKAAWCNQTHSNISSVPGEMHTRCCLSALNMPRLLTRDQAG